VRGVSKSPKVTTLYYYTLLAEMDPHEETSVEETAPVAVEETPEEGSKILTDEPVHSVQVDGLVSIFFFVECSWD